MKRNVIIYFLYRKRDAAEKIFNELVGKELLANNSCVKLVRTRSGNRAVFEDGTQIQMYAAHENARGLWWTSAYIDCDTDPEVIQQVLIPSGKGSKDIVYFD